MRALEMSSGKTSAEIEKMLEQGQLTSEYIMPMVMAMGELAEANGAYTKALMKLGTVENQMKTSGGYAAARIGEAGFTAGLIEFYKDLTKAMSENGRTLDQLGRMYKMVFNGLSYILNNIVVPAVKALGNAFEGLITSFKIIKENGELISGLVGVVMAANFMKMVGVVKIVGAAMAAAFRTPLVIISTIVALLEEVQAVFDADLIGMGENINASEKDRDITAAYMKNKVGMATEKDKALLAANKDYVNTAVSNAGGVGVGLMGLSNMATSFGNFKESFLTGSATPKLPSESYVVNQTINVDGRVSDDQIAQKITEHTKKAFTFNMASNF